MDVLNPAAWTPAQGALVATLALVVFVALWRAARESYRAASTRTVAYAVVLTVLAVTLGQFSIPVGLAKIAPAQHLVNILSAVLLGPWWAALVAFCAAVIRNAAGTGTPLAFPGGMIGALFAGLAWRAARRAGPVAGAGAAAAGEIVGTGVVAAVVSAAVVAPAVLGTRVGTFMYVVPFLLSTLAGTGLGLAALFALRRAGVVDLDSRP